MNNRKNWQDPKYWKNRVESFTGSKLYYTIYASSKEKFQRVTEDFKKIISKHIKGKVLDIGCGYGRISPWIKDYTGIDISPDLIEIAKREYPEKEFWVGDAKNLPFKDKEFDWAICAGFKGSMRELVSEEEWLKADKEIRRVAKQILVLQYRTSDEYEILESNETAYKNFKLDDIK